MIRFALTLVASLTLAIAARAADLPTGTWAVNVDGTKGDFVIKEVKDGKFVGVLLNTDVTGTWDGKTLTFRRGEDTYEALLVSEPGEKGQTKYTLTGTKSQATRSPSRLATIHYVKTGWYAQMSADTPAPAPTGEIKAEVRGILVYEDIGRAYVSVKRKEGGAEIRVWVHASEGEWKLLKQSLPELNGKDVIVTAQLAQMIGKDSGIPSRALYFLGKFDIKFVGAPK